MDAEAKRAELEFRAGVLHFKPEPEPMEALNARVFGFTPDPVSNLRTFYRRAGCSVAHYLKLFTK